MFGFKNTGWRLRQSCIFFSFSNFSISLRNSSVAISAAISAVNANYKDGVNGFNTEIEAFGNCFGTEDFKEGTTAFLEKRKADFPGYRGGPRWRC